VLQALNNKVLFDLEVQINLNSISIFKHSEQRIILCFRKILSLMYEFQNITSLLQESSEVQILQMRYEFKVNARLKLSDVSNYCLLIL